MTTIAVIIVLSAVVLAIRWSYCQRRDELHNTLQGLCEFHNPE